METERARTGREARISVLQIEQDRARPGRLVTRDEKGAIAFESEDGGRSWRRAEDG